MYTSGFWENMDLSETLAGEDQEWKGFGRHHVFFQCAKSVEEKGCAAAEMYRWLEAAYGKDDGSFDYTKFDLPKNKYERAALVALVMYESASPAENMIGDFFYGKSNFL